MKDQGERPLGGGTGFNRYDYVDETGTVEGVKIKLTIKNQPNPVEQELTPTNGSASWTPPSAIAGVQEVQTSIKVGGAYQGWNATQNLNYLDNIQYCRASAVTTAQANGQDPHQTFTGALPESTQ